MQNYKFSILSQTIIIISSLATYHVNAAPCTVSGGQIITSTNCETGENNLTKVSITGGAQVSHNPVGDLTLTNLGVSDSNGISVVGKNSNYQLNTPSSKGDILIDIGNNNNARGRGISVEQNSSATIYANNITVTTKDNYLNDWNANNALWVATGGTLNIHADNLNLSTENATTPYGTVGVNGGVINIQGNNGLSVTNIHNSGASSAGIWAEGGGQANLEIVKIDSDASTPSTDYVMGIYTKTKGSQVTFAGGDIGSFGGSAGSGIRTMELSKVTATGYDNGHLTIETNGVDARGVRATGGSSIDLNSDKHANFVTTIHTKGEIADGLNAGRLGTMFADGSIHKHGGEIGSELASSTVNTYGETHIVTDATTSYGLRAIGDGATINMYALPGQGRSTIHSASTAVRFNFGNGYNLNEDGSSSKGKAQTMTLESVDISSDGKTGKFELSNSNDMSSFSCKLGLCDKNGNNTYASGNLIQVGDHTIDVGVQAQTNNSSYAMTVADAVKEGVLNLKDSTATAAEGTDLLNVTYGGGTKYVADKVSSSFNLNADASILRGSIFTDQTLDKDNEASVTNLHLANNSAWYIERNSNVTSLDVQNSEVYLNRYDNWKDTSGNLLANGPQPSNYSVLTTNQLTGNNGHFYFNTDIVNQQTDKLIVTDINGAAGNHLVTVKNDAGQATTGKETIDIIETKGGSANFNLYKNTPVELGGWEYGLRKTVDGATGKPNGNWQLYANGKKTSTAQAAISFVNTNYMLTYIDMQTLLQRMGELRDTPNSDGNFWVRGFGGRLNAFSGQALDGYNMDYRGTQAGIDKLIRTTSNGRLYIGGMVGYIDADQDFHRGDGSAKNYNIGLYTTYMTNDNFYVDGVIKYSKLKNSFNVTDTQGNSVTGTGNTNAISLSLETGQRFYITAAKQGVYVEPQAQIVYTKNGSDSTKATNSLKVKFNSYDSLIGRGSAIIGYALPNTANPVNIYLKTGYVREFKGNVAYKMNDVKETNHFRGGWFENGLGMSATFNGKQNVYGELDYGNGNRFDKQQINVGYRYTF